jgi:hypothetical protein
MRPRKTFLAATVSLVLLQGCTVLHKDHRDAPWDPRPSQGQLIDQLPAWDDRAVRRCGAHLRPDQRRPGQTDRC